MDVFRYAKLPQRPNDPTRRYQLIRGVERDHVGDVEVSGPAEGSAALTLVCFSVLSDAAREDALTTTRRFLLELVTGWGLQVAEVSTKADWTELECGHFRIQLETVAV